MPNKVLVSDRSAGSGQPGKLGEKPFSPLEERVTSSEPARDMIWRQLFIDREFLKIPVPDQYIADLLGMPRSSVREGVGILIAEGFLTRTRGVMRIRLDVNDLIALFGLRLMIELQAFERISGFNSEHRENIFTELLDVVAAQQRALTDGKLFEWVDSGATFHAGIVRQAGLGPLAGIFRGIIDKICVGSSMIPALEDKDRRSTVTREHLELLQQIRELSLPKDDWRSKIERHARSAMSRALGRQDISVVAGDGNRTIVDVSDKIWSQVRTIAKGPSCLNACS